MTLQNYIQYPTPTLCYFRSQYLIIIFTSILPIRLYTNICSNCRNINITIYLPIASIFKIYKYIILMKKEKKDIVVVFLMMIDLY